MPMSMRLCSSTLPPSVWMSKYPSCAQVKTIMVRSPPDNVRRHPSSPAVMPSSGVVLRLWAMGFVRRKISQYTSARPTQISMGLISGLPSRM